MGACSKRIIRIQSHIMEFNINKKALDALYRKYNRREFVHPDPLEFLYNYEDPGDREIAGLVASSLAYGRVAQILKSVSSVLDRMEPSPREFVEKEDSGEIFKRFEGFKHRFTTGEELAGMLIGAGRVIGKFGSIEKSFLAALGDEKSIVGALPAFACELNIGAGCERSSLVPSPACGSACKRLNLYLRWMIRRDDVDPGGWDSVPASALVVPLDTHMHRICTALGFTQRKQADLRTAVEITDAFRTISPDDPVKYDFALTRLGIRSDTDENAFLEKYRAEQKRK